VASCAVRAPGRGPGRPERAAPGGPLGAAAPEAGEPGTARSSDPSAERFAAQVTAVAAAFGDPTRREIYLYVRAHPGVTASAVAEAFSLHPNVARHHLERLAAGGYLEVSVRPSESGAGRPAKRYTVAGGEQAEAHLGLLDQRDELLLSLLAEAVAALGPHRAEQLAERVGETYGRTLARRMDPGHPARSVRAAMHAVADALTAHGFAARAEDRGALTAVVAERCPFGDAAAASPALCAVDRGLVRGLLAGLCGQGPGSVPVVLSSRARGDDVCSALA
jgi:predicted ArsR family transcriptional regulator